MGGTMTCAERHIFGQPVSEDIWRALQLTQPQVICSVQSAWVMDGTVVALATTYLSAIPDPAPDEPPGQSRQGSSPAVGHGPRRRGRPGNVKPSGQQARSAATSSRAAATDATATAVKTGT